MISGIIPMRPGAFPDFSGVCVMRNKLAAAGAAGVGGLLAATGAQAAIDVTSVVSEIEGAATPIASIGAAVLIVLVGIKVYKWIRRAM